MPTTRWARFAQPTPQTRALLCGPAAVDRVIGAGDLGGVVAAEKQRERRHLVRGHELLGWLRFQQHVVDDLLLGQVACLHGFRDLVLDQRRPDIAGRDAVAGDPVGRKLQRNRLGQTNIAVLLWVNRQLRINEEEATADREKITGCRDDLKFGRS